MKKNDEARMSNDERMTNSENRRSPAEDLFWDVNLGSVVREEPETRRVYDLEERTASFVEAVTDFARTIQQDAVTNRIISQLVGAATSVGANYVEADDAVSKKEFLKSIGTCRKEARETKHFFPDDRPSRAGLETTGAYSLARSQRTASHFLQNLENQMIKANVMRGSKQLPGSALRHLNFVIPSSFVIRISSF